MSTYHGGRTAAYFDVTMQNRDTGEYYIAVSEENHPGYWPDGAYATPEDAQKAAEAYNERRGLSRREAQDLIVTSMFYNEHHMGGGES